MKKDLKRLGGDSLLYAAMNMGTKLIAFLMLPVFSYYLSLEEYGMLDYMDRITSMMIFLIIFGTDSAFSFYYYDAKKTEEKLEYTRVVLWFRLLVASLLLAIAFLFGSILSNWIFHDSSYASLFYISFGVLWLDSVVSFILVVLRFQFKVKKVVFFTILKMLLVAVLSYLFLVLFDQTPEMVLLGRLIGICLVIIILGKEIFPLLKFNRNWDKWKQVLKYGAPLVPASLSFWLIANSNVFFLERFTDFETVGVYGTAVKFAMMITLVTTGIQMAWRPFAMNMKDDAKAPELFSHVYLLLMAVGGIGLVLLAILSPYIVLLLDESYQVASPYIAPLAISSFLNFYYLIISTGLLIKKKTKVITYAFMAAAVISVILNIFLIPPFKLWGAIISYVVSYLISTVWIYIASQKEFYVPTSSSKLLAIGISSFLALFLIVYYQVADLPFYYEGITLLMFLLVLHLSGITNGMKQILKGIKS